MIFIDLEKIHDKILRNIMWWALEKNIVPTNYITLIKHMYTDIVNSMRAYDDEFNASSIKIELHQESILNSNISP
jgi:hypothetical protein